MVQSQRSRNERKVEWSLSSRCEGRPSTSKTCEFSSNFSTVYATCSAKERHSSKTMPRYLTVCVLWIGGVSGRVSVTVTGVVWGVENNELGTHVE